MSIANGEKLNAANWQDFVSRLHDGVRGSQVKNHITADAVFVVQKHAEIVGLDSDYAEEKLVHFDGSTWYSPEEYWSDLDEDEQESLNQEAISLHECSFEECDEYDQWEMLGDLDGHTVTGLRREWQDVNSHLTREAAEAFIKRKQHDYPPLRVYVKSAYFCWEYCEIIDAILTGKLVYVDQGVTNEQANS
ncbi:hypothetical protein [Pantoea agglomerans]|uniref:Uncharacterized protein n=1 Tax=Enterobacter agglomerans TaxID=549 RepID=A0ACC5PWY7_ENTAG|nr:hypothetical protein [Pantoea agglomerans]MBD8129329.1 hypothetical protein [Pantoea agglomerans]